MIEWANPWALLLLPLALWLPWRGGGPRLPWPSVAALQARGGPRLWLAPLPPLLGAAGLCLLVAALARPQLVNRERIVEHEGIDIMLVLDTSGSMDAEDYTLSGRGVTRLRVAKEVIADFAAGRPDDRIGLVVFGEEAFTQVPLTLDKDALVSILSQVELGVAGRRATAIGDAMAVAGARLKDLDAPEKLMILLTDGSNNAGQVSPLEAAEALRALGVKVYTVGIGTVDGEIIGFEGWSMRVRLDEETLKQIAQKTAAEYFYAGSAQDLKKVYQSLSSRLTLEKKETEITALFTLAGALLALLSGGLSLLWFGRVL